ncbi:HD domain-containing protein [Demequina sp.]|uniref:HD domain-containing protein n=1 Tax=Demequina sp. TaxID=2050685 RepID=UPI003D132E86
MTIDVEALIAPPSPIAARAHEVATQWCSPDLVSHCLRSWVWAVALAERNALEYDAELLYVATMLHDIGVTENFDSHTVAFEVAGGAVGSVFAAGAGWDAYRCDRVAQIIERHMWTAVDPAEDPEGHLLEAATSIDVAGAGVDQLDAAFLRAVTAAIPRGEFTETFDAQIRDQAQRKPHSNALRLENAGRVAAGGDVWERIMGGAS